MHKNLLIIGLSITLTSCASRPTTAVNTKKSTLLVTQTKKITPKKENNLIKIDNIDFYQVNIADLSKNNNTISYGSIVSANPQGYSISKEHFPSVGQNFRERFIIIHYTALDYEKSIKVLTQKNVSAHYLVNDRPDKEIYQLVDENKRSYHAGVSHWRNFDNLNDNSIGIEIVNSGFVLNSSGQRQFFPYPDYQFRKVAALIKDLATRYMIPPTNILGHSDIAPTRKQDPGPMFPWKKLYDDYGLGMWYDTSSVQNYITISNDDIVHQYNSPAFIAKVQKKLKDFGYAINITSTWDKDTKKVIQSFQYHFHPSKTDGVLDAETWAILQSLYDKYK
ncbi:N-acetylmuramoyl-L-alanine amidase [Riemerella columbipharyngis]|nr:N-acetylmuramoyl-L-alanine amidase [Riemerella columbipharyngis]